jgi:Zn-dependent protease
MMGNMPRWKLFSVWGNPVYVEPLFLLLMAFFVFSGLTSMTQFAEQLMWAPVLFIGILWHEIGHAVAIQRFGYGNSDIILQGLGGVTVNRRGQTPPGKAAVISVAGPVFSFSLTLVFGIAAALIPGEGLLNWFCFLMAAANGFWGAFNLLPIAPLDGGHIVLHGLRSKFPQRKAYLYSAYSSLVAMAVIGIPMVVIFNMSMIFIVILGFLFVSHNMQVIRAIQGGAAV